MYCLIVLDAKCKSFTDGNYQHLGSTNTAVVLLGTLNRPVAASYPDCLTKSSEEFT
jgi:hypothetical protein